ncbi:hypothetical protein A1OE_102 [Candidatus Endolissoclinum faulkneri L2]|uniref:Uncharacterized protein n=1 Tax=Candidatus Endolissoclinum faulkneri L2 TaxID=1193729 RepID=K7Z2W4_9PROT|nr:hypothetical protein A1OE_102 [Candidatus Endolissoclinum faulkneri L2]
MIIKLYRFDLLEQFSLICSSHLDIINQVTKLLHFIIDIEF